jgi:LmbE family N-acetylglucosaminyl deacetylase
MYQNILAVIKAPVKAVAIRLIDWRLLIRSKPFKSTSKSAIVFAPHQDDESFGCGGMIALKRAQGTPVKVVFLTDGGKSYGWDRLPAGALVEARQKEALQALEVLGVSPQAVTFLNQPDGELDQISDEERQNLVNKIARLLSEVEPEEVYVTYRRDVFPDHEVASQIVRLAIRQVGLSVRLFEYPIWSLYQPLLLDLRSPEFAMLYRLPIKSVRAKKRQAIACHVSQYKPLPPDTHGGLPKGFLNRLSSSYEFFFSSSLKDD